MSTENMVGKKITFKDWKGDTREGEITAILKNGDYEVSTDRGIALVTNSEILKMKRGGYVPKATQMKRAKVAEVMQEFKEGKLHSGSKNGPIVKDRDQAIAIALAEANSKKMGTGGGTKDASIVAIMPSNTIVGRKVLKWLEKNNIKMNFDGEHNWHTKGYGEEIYLEDEANSKNSKWVYIFDLKDFSNRKELEKGLVELENENKLKIAISYLIETPDWVYESYEDDKMGTGGGVNKVTYKTDDEIYANDIVKYADLQNIKASKRKVGNYYYVTADSAIETRESMTRKLKNLVASKMSKGGEMGWKHKMAKGGGVAQPEWLFIGVYPNAYVYSDKRDQKSGDYHKIGQVTFSPLRLNIFDDSKKYADVQKIMIADMARLKKQGEVEISATGQKAKINMAKGGGVKEADTIMYVELQSVGNADYGDAEEKRKNIAVKKVYVDSIEEAQDVVQQFIERHDLGSGNWTGGKVFKDGKNIGFIAYNGRFFEGVRPYANGGSTSDQYNVSIDWEQNKPKLKYGRKFFKNIYANSNEEAENFASEQWNSVKANSNKKVLSINSINMTQLRKKPILDKPERKMTTGGDLTPTFESGVMISKPYYFFEKGFFTTEEYRIDNKFYNNVRASFVIANGIATKDQALEKANAFYEFVKSAQSKEEYDDLSEQFIIKNRKMAEGVGVKETKTKMGKITISDIISGARFKAKSGTVFIVDSTDGKIVESSFEGGAKGNYRDPIGDFVAFMNEQKATRVMVTGGSMYAEGGGVSKYSVDEYDLEKLQSSGVTINQMNEILKKSFPDSFGFTLYPVKDDSPSNYRYLIPNTDDYYGIKDASLKISFNRYHGMSYRVYQGGENTYFYFILDGSDGSGYIGNFGFKDQGDVPKEYVTSFTALLNKLYGFPFQVSHEVYATGGSTDGSDIYVPVNKEVSKERIDDFVNYVEMFYGKDEDAMGKDGYTKAQIRTAVKKYLMDLDAQKAYTWGNGDSLDRERVFPYLMNPSQKGIKNPSFAKGGGLSSFNPKSFTLDELKDYLWENDIYISWFQKGWIGITPASETKKIWDGTSHSLLLKLWKDKKLTISDYGHLEVEKGSENLYLDLIVYELDGSDDPYTIRIYTKENHKGLKEFANHIIDKFKKGGSAGWKHKMK